MDETAREADAIAAIAAGDFSQFDPLVDRYKNRVFGFVRRKISDVHRAEDLTQDIFLRLFRAVRAGAYDGRSPILPWLFTIANNRVIDYLRSEHSKPTLQAKPPPAKPPPQTPADQAVGNELAARLRRLIEELPAEQREVVELKLMDGLTFVEIAALTGCPVTTAKSRLAYALKKLQAALRERPLE